MASQSVGSGSGRPGAPKSSGSGGAGWAMAAVVVIAVAATVAATVVVSSTEGGRAVATAVSEDLGDTQALQTVLQQQRYQRLNLISRIFSTDQVLTSYLAEAAQKRDEEAILASIEEYQNLLTFDLAVVLDSTGTVLERTDDRSAEGEDLSTTPLIEVALEESKASGVWLQGDQLYHAVAVPLVREFDLVGYIAVAYAIDNGLATQIQRTGGADVVFLAKTGTGPQPTAGTLAGDRATELVDALRRAGDVIQRVMERGETAQDIELDLGGAPWRASLSPLRDAAGQSVGAAVALTSVDERVGAFQRVRLAALGVGGVALLLGSLLVVMLARRATEPFRRVADAAVQGAQGHYEIAMPKAGGDAGRIADAMGTLFAGLREQAAAQFVALRVARLLPEPAKATGRSKKAEAATACALGIDMRRYADPKLGYDPDENLARLARDVQRASTSAGSQNGRLVSLQGHRLLLLFEGEQATWRAFCAAAEILLTLGQKENAFDEAKPPVIALSSGPMVLGTVSAGDRASAAVAGVPVVFLDALMREAAPGYLYFTKQVYAELAKLFQRGQAEVKGQRSALGSKHPLYLLDADTAARLTGAKPLAGDDAGAGEQRSLADLSAGTVLANRFEFLAELGAGRQGVVWKAEDRQMGDLVLLKMLRPEVVQDGATFDRLKRAVAKARAIRHPNVLSVLDFGAAEGLPFIETEFVRGMTLAYLIEQARVVPVIAGVRMARQIAYGLGAAHGQQLMHGSLKPSNILVEVSGEIRVMDFGLGATTVRQGQATSGAAYMAPEQLAGQEPDSRADFWSYGVVVYQMLTGQLPFPGTSVDELRQRIANQEPAAPTAVVAEIPPALESILMRCLAKAPDQRYASSADLLAALEEVEV